MTKIWRKNESERIKEHLQENPGLFNFVIYMYSENTSERQSEGRTPYLLQEASTMVGTKIPGVKK